ncbi:MAG: VWA domain-containing protein, partial [Luteolibacter sp.]
MPPFVLQKPEFLWLLPLLAVFAFLHRLRVAKRRTDTAAFGAAATRPSSGHGRLAMMLLTAAAIIFALARPATNPHPKTFAQEGRDIVFVLDVSRSMLAEDLLPNRLGSAKNSIAECVAGLENHRVGLVVFGGSSSIVCPLTSDTGFFLDALALTGPESVSHGGTRIGDALIKTCDKLFSGEEQGFRDIVLITDGGDQSESLQKAIDMLNEKKVKLIAIGIGDERTGSRIPDPTGDSDFVTYKNEEIWSKLDTAQLTALTKSVDKAAFLPVGTRRMKLGDIYERLSAQEGKRELAGTSAITYDGIFQAFIAIALIALTLMAVVPRMRIKRAAAVLLLLPFFIQDLNANTLNNAESLFAKGDYEAADEILTTLAEQTPYPELLFAKGNTEFRLSRFEEAAATYDQALALQPGSPLIRHLTFNLANTLLRQAAASDDMYMALSLTDRALSLYRKILLTDPSDKPAATNTELARIERAALRERIAADEKRRAELQLALDKITEQIKALIIAQSTNLINTDTYLKTDPPPPEPAKAPTPTTTALTEAEQSITTDTTATRQLAAETQEKFFGDIPGEASPLGETLAQLEIAVTEETAAAEQLPLQPTPGREKEQLALDALRAALEALPKDPEEAGEGDEGAEGEEGDPSDADSEDGEEGEDGEATEGEDGEMSDA